MDWGSCYKKQEWNCIMKSYITVIIHIILLLFVLRKYEVCGMYDTDEGQTHGSFAEISRGKENRGLTESIAREFVENWR